MAASMAQLPDDVGAVLLRGVGTYIRETPQQELPSNLRRYRGFRPQALNAHRKTLLAVLDDDALRARIGHWLENDKPPLSKEDARLLAIAVTRDEGWEEELRGASRGPREKARSAATDDSKLEAERDKTRKAKEESKKAREDLKALQAETAARISELEARLTETEKRSAEAEKEAAGARKEADAAIERARKFERRSKSATEKAERDRDAARREAKELRRQVTALQKELETAAAQPDAPARRPKKTADKKRKPLNVPKGRLGDDPATLESWLARDDVILLVDGYNVAKADGGFEELQLESQRERLVDALFTVAKMTETETIVVFDAQRVPGRRTRRARRPVVVEWSNPGQIADDYIVAKLESLPQDPVILVTNDKELQDRGRALDATIATSQQLLALFR